MSEPARPNFGAFPYSPYASELRRGGNHAFSPETEAEYTRVHLYANRTLIRMACVLAAVLSGGRVLEQVTVGPWDQPVISLSALAASIVLVVIAWSPLFERFYLPAANVVVPARNALGAFGLGVVGASGQVEVWMLLPLMLIGPFFFMGLRFRVALFAVAVTIASFAAATVMADVATGVAARSIVFLVVTAAACAIAAYYLERWSRKSFLESHLIEELAQHDTLTGLKNRRVFDERFESLWQRAIDEERLLAILMVDIDYFKDYNDRYGHQAGDIALRRVAQAVQGLVTRPLDVVARYGGEEFAVLLYDIDSVQADALAERIRRAVADLAIEHRESPVSAVVTISVGVAVVQPSLERRSRGALQLADQALYEAKVLGRNRVELLDDAAHRLLVTGVFSKRSTARR